MIKSEFFKKYSSEIAVGVLSSLIASAITFYLFRQNIIAIVKNSLAILKLDETIKELEEVSRPMDRDAFRAVASTQSVDTELERQKSSIEKSTRELDLLNANIQNLVAMFDRLNVDSSPAKLDGTHLIPEPDKEFKQQLEKLTDRIHAAVTANTEAMSAVNGIRDKVDQRESQIVLFVTDQCESALGKVEKARISLSKGIQVLRDTIAEFGEK